MSSPRNHALRLLAKQEYSTHELREKLAKKFPDQTEAIEEVLIVLKERDWLSDERFCESFIHDQLLTTKPGPLKIMQKLASKGVSRDFAQEQVALHYPEEKQLEIVQELAEKKRSEIVRRGKLSNDFKIRQKVIIFLVSRGFSFDIAKHHGS